jgi:hypothetical protein
MSLKSLAGFTGLFGVVAVVLAVVCSSCSSPVAVKTSDTATITVKMGCYYQGFLCTNLYKTDGVSICHDTTVIVPKGNEIYLSFIYSSKSYMLDRQVDFICEHDTTFDYQTPLSYN